MIPAKKTLLVVVRFYTKKPDKEPFKGRLEFENFFGLRHYAVDV